MLQRIIQMLKTKKQQLQSVSTYNLNEKDIKLPFEIILSKENNFFKMEISDYISIVDYVDKMNLIDSFGIEDMISNAVLWNSSKQKVNCGTYYAVIIGNRLYNILINDDYIKIDERVTKNEIIEEKILLLDIKNIDYSYTFHKHDKTGDTFYTRYFNKKGFSFGKLALSMEDFLNDFNELISNLDSIKNISKVINIELIKNYVLDELERTNLQKRL